MQVTYCVAHTDSSYRKRSVLYTHPLRSIGRELIDSRESAGVGAVSLSMGCSPPPVWGRYINPCCHRRIQDFTMEGVHVVWARARRPGGTKSPEAEAKCEIAVQFLSFSCTTFRI